MTTLVTAIALPAGGQSARWGGEGPTGLVADGIYSVRLSVTDALGQVAERSESVSVIRAVRKLRLSRSDVGRNGAVTASWQQTQEATLSGDLSTGSRAPASLIAAVIEPGPQTFRLTAGQLAAMPDGTYTFALRARTAVGEQTLRASFRLDRRPPSARFVRLRVSGRKAFLVVRLPEAATVRVLAGARVVVARKLRRAGLNGFRFRLPAGVPARLRLQLTDPGGQLGAGRPVPPALRRRQPESDETVSSGTIWRIGARRASSLRLASSSSPGASLAPFTIRPRTARLRRARGLERQRRVVDGSAAGPADDHERKAEGACDVGGRESPAERREQAGRALDEHPVAASAQRQVDLAHVLGVDRLHRRRRGRREQALALVRMGGRTERARHAADQPAGRVVLADLHCRQHRGREPGLARAGGEQRADVGLADAVVGTGDEHVEQCLWLSHAA